MLGTDGLMGNSFFDMDIVFCILLSVGAILWAIGYRTWGIRLVLLVLIPFFVLTLTPCGSWLLMRLENVHEERTTIPQDVEGMIVLGGGIESVEGSARQQPLYGASAGRVFEALRLAHHYPSLKILLTGRPGEVSLTKTLFEEHAINPSRLILETQSDSTVQNAKESYRLVEPGHRPWLLVTSASHMKRAVGVFEKNGWTVVPYPVDYKTAGSLKTLKIGGPARQAFCVVTREWLATLWSYVRPSHW